MAMFGNQMASDVNQSFNAFNQSQGQSHGPSVVEIDLTDGDDSKDRRDKRRKRY